MHWHAGYSADARSITLDYATGITAINTREALQHLFDRYANTKLTPSFEQERVWTAGSRRGEYVTSRSEATKALEAGDTLIVSMTVGANLPLTSTDNRYLTEAGWAVSGPFDKSNPSGLAGKLSITSYIYPGEPRDPWKIMQDMRKAVRELVK